MFDVADINRERGRWLRRNSGSSSVIARQSGGGTVTAEPVGEKLALYKPFWPQPALLPPLVPAVRKRNDASVKAAGGPRRVGLL